MSGILGEHAILSNLRLKLLPELVNAVRSLELVGVRVDLLIAQTLQVVFAVLSVLGGIYFFFYFRLFFRISSRLLSLLLLLCCHLSIFFSELLSFLKLSLTDLFASDFI